MNKPIDIVLPWVDGNDPEWIRERNETAKKYRIIKDANSNVRYESWDNLQYVFRGIEKFMPWVHKILLVTNGQVPEFLNLDNPKIKLIKHSDYMPEEYLPTFNSNVIELNYHRIAELSDNFVLFNDDCYPLKPIPETYYFKGDLPCDEAVESPIMPVDVGAISNYASFVKANNVLFINRHFKKREVQEKNWDKWYFSGYGELLDRNRGLHYWNNFAGFHDYHMPVPLKKSTMQKIWDTDPILFDKMSHNQFRDASDMSQCVVRYWQLCTGEFVPQKSIGKPYLVTKENYREVADGIRKHVSQMVCLTEDCTPEEFSVIKREINSALQEVFPDKCSFEK